ncbi:ThiF family adenylyltransferase [Nocardia sp. R16R-3T]
MEFDYNIAFQRIGGLLEDGDRDAIRRTSIGIAGLGGCGSNHLLALVRMGFEKFSVADPDRFEMANFNRQAGATMPNLGRSKVDVMVEMALDINPRCVITRFDDGLSDQNVESFAASVDIGINAIDWFRVDLYEQFHDCLRAQGKPSLVGGVPLSFGASISVISPATPSFSEVFGFVDGDTQAARLTKFVSKIASCGFAADYLAPGVNSIEDPVENTRIASVSPGLYLATALTCTEVFAVVTGRRSPTYAPDVLQVDLVRRALDVSRESTPVR